MKRMIIFLLTNLAAVAMLTIVASLVCAFFGIDLAAETQGGGYGSLFILAFLVGMIGSVISLLMSKTMVKLSMRCRTIDGSEGPAEAWLVSTVADLAMRAGVKTPEVAIYPGAANAFATGAFKNSALVAVSTDIMAQMSREELRAVLAHEMSHVANGDMVTMSLTQGVINTFVIFFSHVLAYVIQSAGRNERDDRRRSGGFGMHYILTQLFQMIFGLLASIVVFWYSRKREYAADAGSAKLLGSPSPMIAALRRLGNLQPGVLPDSIKAFGIAGSKTSIFATHPSLEDRITALQNLMRSLVAVAAFALLGSSAIAAEIIDEPFAVSRNESEKLVSAEAFAGKYSLHKYSFSGTGAKHTYKIGEDDIVTRAPNIDCSWTIAWPEEKSGLSTNGLKTVRKAIVDSAFGPACPEAGDWKPPEKIEEVEAHYKKQARDLWLCSDRDEPMHCCSRWTFVAEVSLNWPFGIKGGEEWYEKPVIVFKNAGYENDGGNGCHGYVTCGVHSLPDGRVLDETDYFRDDKMDELFQLVLERLFRDNDLDVEDTIDKNIDAIVLKPGELHFLVSEEGMTWFVNPYRIFPGCQGITSVTIEWSDLYPYLKSPQ